MPRDVQISLSIEHVLANITRVVSNWLIPRVVLYDRVFVARVRARSHQNSFYWNSFFTVSSKKTVSQSAFTQATNSIFTGPTFPCFSLCSFVIKPLNVMDVNTLMLLYWYRQRQRRNKRRWWNHPIVAQRYQKGAFLNLI